VDYSSLISPLLKSAQDQELKIATLSNENQQLKSEIQTLKEEVSQIKAMLVK
jgi:cell division protein FtsB